MNWRAQAACRGKDWQIFFAEPGVSNHEARAICATCPVRKPCLLDALAHNDEGFRGGLSDRQRRRLKAGELLPQQCENRLCDEMFVRRRRGQKFCSDTCAHRAACDRYYHRKIAR